MTIDEIKAANEAAGFHFFERGSMRFFSSRVSSQTFGRFFVTSEKNEGLYSSYPRLYSVRRLRHDGTIDTIGEFQAYKSLSGAVKAARAHDKRESSA